MGEPQPPGTNAFCDYTCTQVQHLYEEGSAEPVDRSCVGRVPGLSITILKHLLNPGKLGECDHTAS